jgi:adenylate cyclase
VAVVAYTRAEAAARAGVELDFVDRLLEFGILAPDDPEQCTPGDVRRVIMARTLMDAGLPLDGVASSIRSGSISIDFLDAPTYERFSALSTETFRQVSARTGIPLELLAVVRESLGYAEPSPDDLLRDDEIAIVPFVELQVAVGFRPGAIERLLRVQGDAMRRVTEQEGAWWHSEVIEPALAAGRGAEGMATPEYGARMTELAETSIIAMYHAQQARAWTANLIDGFEALLAQAGLHSRLERPPAMCFLDITGYTRLTQERGDDAAAELAGSLARLVQRSSVQHGGKPVKWLGDGVMLYFRDPGPAVRSALEMVGGIPAAGLPPAHVGLHAGPVLFQEGDYFGQTVNLSSRIADYARPGEVLVSQAVADAPDHDGIVFDEVGDVELKGVPAPVHLLRAHFA